MIAAAPGGALVIAAAPGALVTAAALGGALVTAAAPGGALHHPRGETAAPSLMVAGALRQGNVASARGGLIAVVLRTGNAVISVQLLMVVAQAQGTTKQMPIMMLLPEEVHLPDQVLR